MDLLLIADRDGYVIATRDAIAKDLGIGRNEVDWGLAKLMEPDPESGNPDSDGRRLEAIEGRGYGWRIINYGFYRDVKTSDDLRAAHARRQAEYRERKATRDTSDNHVTPQAQAQAQTQNQPQSKKEQEPKKERARKRAELTPMPDPFEISDQVKAWAARFNFDRLDRHLENFREQAQARAYVYADWDAAFKLAIRKDWAGIRSEPKAQTGKPVLGKTAQAIHTLEAMKNVERKSNPGTDATVDVPRLGRPACG